MRHDKLLTKNDVEFRMYRKFSAEAVVTFDDAKTNAGALAKATANAGYPATVKQ